MQTKVGQMAMWEYIIGGATVFGVIVGLFSVYNGRATRRYIGDLIKEEARLDRELMERYEKILERHEKILERLSEQHNTLIKQQSTIINALKRT